MFAAVPLIVSVEVAVKAENVAVPENAGAFEKTRRPVPVSSVNEFKRNADVAVVVARDEESKNNPRDAVSPENVVRPVSVAADIDGDVSVLAVSVCVPPTVTTDAAFVPAVVTRRSPVETVKTAAECVMTEFPLSKLMRAPVSKKRSSHATVPDPRSAPPSASGNAAVFAVTVSAENMLVDALYRKAASEPIVPAAVP
jgi:hypothetical protein